MSEVTIKMEDISQVKKKLLFEIPWGEVKEGLDVVYRNLGKKSKIKGFRPGKVPRKVLENYFKETAEGETITNIVNKFYWQALDDRHLSTLSQPEIEQQGLKENADFLFSASFEIEPIFEPKGYTGLELEKENIKVTEDDLEKRLIEIRKMFATMEEVQENRSAEMGDFVTIDFSGTHNGESSEGLKGENFLLELGSKRFVPGFEEQIAGMKTGENKTISVTFPADYHEKKFAGQEVLFAVTIKNMKEQKLPELDEQFIKNFDKYNSLEDLKNDVRKTMEQECGRITERKFQDKIIQSLIAENDFELPPSLVERQIFYMMADTQKRMTSAGMDEENAMQLAFKMHDNFKEEAQKTVKTFLLIKKIAETEKIKIQEEDIDKHIKELSDKFGHDFENIKKVYENEERKNALESELIQKKVFDFIEGKANIKIVNTIGMGTEEKS